MQIDFRQNPLNPNGAKIPFLPPAVRLEECNGCELLAKRLWTVMRDAALADPVLSFNEAIDAGFGAGSDFFVTICDRGLEGVGFNIDLKRDRPILAHLPGDFLLLKERESKRSNPTERDLFGSDTA
jgi:hypothetical protein